MKKMSFCLTEAFTEKSNYPYCQLLSISQVAEFLQFMFVMIIKTTQTGKGLQGSSV